MKRKKDVFRELIEAKDAVTDACVTLREAVDKLNSIYERFAGLVLSREWPVLISTKGKAAKGAEKR